MTLATRPSSPPPTATTAAALPGLPTVCTRMPWCTCPRAPRRPASTTSPRRAPRSRSRSSTTTTACALPPRRPKNRARRIAGHRLGWLHQDSVLDHAGLRHHGRRGGQTSWANLRSTVPPTSLSRPAWARLAPWWASPNSLPEQPAQVRDHGGRRRRLPLPGRRCG